MSSPSPAPVVSFRLPVDLIEPLRAEADRRAVPVTTIIVEAVRAVVAPSQVEHL